MGRKEEEKKKGERGEREERGKERGNLGPLPAPHPAMLQRTTLCLVPSTIKECLCRPESSYSTQTNLNRKLKNRGTDMILNGTGKCN